MTLRVSVAVPFTLTASVPLAHLQNAADKTRTRNESNESINRIEPLTDNSLACCCRPICCPTTLSLLSRPHLNHIMSSGEEAEAIRKKREQIAIFKNELMSKVGEHEDLLHDMQEEQAHLAVFKKELLEKVDEHLQEQARMEEEQAHLAVFKEELISAVDEHLQDIHKSEDKAAVVAKLKEEMLQKVDKHERNVGLRASF
jgi:hypothetical protein